MWSKNAASLRPPPSLQKAEAARALRVGNNEQGEEQLVCELDRVRLTLGMPLLLCRCDSYTPGDAALGLGAVVRWEQDGLGVLHLANKVGSLNEGPGRGLDWALQTQIHGVYCECLA